jgi:hypothetical protein
LILRTKKMASGGFRSNSGRPRGSKNVPKAAPEPAAEKPEKEEPGKRVKPFSRDQAEAAAISYLASVVVDVAADTSRRDRAAVALLGLTRAKPRPPKREPRDPMDWALEEFKTFGR